MATRSLTLSLLAGVLSFSGCSPSLPLGEPELHQAYSGGVIVGAITRQPLTGQYVVLANGAPVPVTNFNDQQPALADSIDEDRLPDLIGAQAHLLAAGEERKERARQRVYDARPADVKFANYQTKRIYIGPRLAQP